MTSVSGYYLVKAPCCGTLYSKPAYSSINMMDWKRWSDGLEGGSLYSNPKGVCKCICGDLFLTKDTVEEDLVRLNYRDIQRIKPSEEPIRR
jgi:hypothetical protein